MALPGKHPTEVHRFHGQGRSTPLGPGPWQSQSRRRIEKATMSREVKHQMGRSVGVPPEWTSVLAVIAHPDDASFGLGAILDTFVFAGAKVEILCLTHGQAWTLEGAPGDPLPCAGLSWLRRWTCSARLATRWLTARMGP